MIGHLFGYISNSYHLRTERRWISSFKLRSSKLRAKGERLRSRDNGSGAKTAAQEQRQRLRNKDDGNARAAGANAIIVKADLALGAELARRADAGVLAFGCAQTRMTLRVGWSALPGAKRPRRSEAFLFDSQPLTRRSGWHGLHSQPQPRRTADWQRGTAIPVRPRALQCAGSAAPLKPSYRSHSRCTGRCPEPDRS